MNTGLLADEAETLARMFADKYPTDNVKLAIAYAEAGRISWEDIASLFAKSYASAVAEVN